MLDDALFLGFPLSDSFLLKLKNLPPQITAEFIQEQPSDYLQKVDYQEMSYLGKCLETPFDLRGLDTLQANIDSLLKRLVPDFPYQDHPLRLFSLPSVGIV